MHTATSAANLTHTPAAMHRVRLLVPGLALTGALAFASIQLGRIGWLQSNGISALTLAIALATAWMARWLWLGGPLLPGLAG